MSSKIRRSNFLVCGNSFYKALMDFPTFQIQSTSEASISLCKNSHSLLAAIRFKDVNVKSSFRWILTYLGDAHAPEQTALKKSRERYFFRKWRNFFPFFFPQVHYKTFTEMPCFVKIKMFVQTFPAFLKCIKGDTLTHDGPITYLSRQSQTKPFPWLSELSIKNKVIRSAKKA